MKISYKDFCTLLEWQRNGIYEVKGWGTFYFVNGVIHREDGPALKHINGTKEWFINGKRHSLDGPAIEWHTGNVEYYIEGVEYSTKKEFEAAAYLYKNGLQNYL